jgi:adenylate cyclase
MTTPFSEIEIRATLLRITASEPFRNAPQLVSFLTFVVEKQLAGEAQAIKGYTIATQALGRPEDFDPQADPIVRVEAGRLRRALDSYYTVQGRAEPIRIVIPRGTYVPQFAAESDDTDLDRQSGEGDSADPPALGMAPAEPVDAPLPGRAAFERGGVAPRWLLACAYFVLVLGVAGLLNFALAKIAPDWSFAARETSADTPDGHVTIIVAPIELSGQMPGGFSADLLRSMVLDGLARFDGITVVDFAHAPKVPAGERYVLNLRARSSGAARIVARLTHEPSGRIIWARGFEAPLPASGDVSVENDLARQIATVIAQPYGVLFASLRMRSDLDGGLRCVIEAYDYWSSPTAGAHLKARGCLEAVAASRPNAVTALANLTYFYLDEYRVGYNPLPDPLDRALASARRAIELAPDSPRANQALMAALFVRGNVDEALNLGRRALELNPFDTDIMADLGARLVQVGQYREGSNLILQASSANPADPPWYDFFLFLAAYMQDDFDTARAAASRITTNEYVPGLIAKIAMAAHDRQPAQAQELLTRMVAIQPEYATDPEGALAKRNFTPEIKSRLLAALRNAGLRA